MPIIPCPICQTDMRYMLKSMDGTDYYRCENCNEEFRVKIEKIEKGQ